MFKTISFLLALLLCISMGLSDTGASLNEQKMNSFRSLSSDECLTNTYTLLEDPIISAADDKLTADLTAALMSGSDEFCDIKMTDTTVQTTCDFGSFVDHSDFKDACKSASGKFLMLSVTMRNEAQGMTVIVGVKNLFTCVAETCTTDEINQLLSGIISENFGTDEFGTFEISFNEDTSGANGHQVSLALFTLVFVFITLST
uniref:Uncharacterized protein n=1 Tax=Ditylum brightwellii TaxID=49249 RepID=A0A6V2F9J3_9STRA|mmetsp:Transcript_66646/g.98823  ORF Transcript_66646/g.98823 Transcript_66646/m.98823 type:complete len:202 (+) Transcript_66646:272-877(+)